MSADHLTRADLDLHQRFGIDSALLEAAGVCRVTDQQARNDCGVTGPAGTLDGIFYPHRDVSGRNRSGRVRRDVVPDGAPKYVAMKGRHSWAFPPGAAERAHDADVTVVFVEAEKSMLALEAAAWRTGAALLPIALGGIDGWSGRIGKRETAEGRRYDERGPLPDFDALLLKDRDVVVLFDANLASRSDLQKKRERFAGHLVSLGARVRIGTVPDEPGCNGPDDYRAAHDDVALLKLIDEAVPHAAQPHEDRDDGGAKGPSQATRLVQMALAAGAVPFASPDGDLFLQAPVRAHVEILPMKSPACKSWLVGIYFVKTQAAPSGQALNDAVGTLAAHATFTSVRYPVSMRVASGVDTLFLDLGDASWQAVEITANGWRLIDVAPVRFRRPRGQHPLPAPVTGGVITELHRFLNVDDDGFVLIVAYLLAALRPTGPYPVLALQGQQGTGKSVAGRVLKMLIDPGAAPLRSEPREVRDLMVAATNTHLAAFDNLSRLPDWLSDALCRMATGGGFSTRALYTDGDEMIFDAMRPVILTGIDDYVTRADLSERAISVRLQPIPDTARRQEADFWREFEEARPRILGALLDAVAVGLRQVDELHLPEKPRMADFAQWAAACAPGCGWSSDRFLEVYRGARAVGVDALLADDPVAQAVMRVPRPWTGTSTTLLAVLADYADATVSKDKRQWPSSSRGLSSHLERIAPLLASHGILAFRDRRSSARRWHLEDIGKEASSASSAPPLLAEAEIRQYADDEPNDVAARHPDEASSLPPVAVAASSLLHPAFVGSGENPASDADDADAPTTAVPSRSKEVRDVERL